MVLAVQILVYPQKGRKDQKAVQLMNYRLLRFFNTKIEFDGSDIHLTMLSMLYHPLRAVRALGNLSAACPRRHMSSVSKPTSSVSKPKWFQFVAPKFAISGCSPYIRLKTATVEGSAILIEEDGAPAPVLRQISWHMYIWIDDDSTDDVDSFYKLITEKGQLDRVDGFRPVLRSMGSSDLEHGSNLAHFIMHSVKYVAYDGLRTTAVDLEYFIENMILLRLRKKGIQSTSTFKVVKYVAN
jgi:hypothetical protein